jgi:hypothetical protein
MVNIQEVNLPDPNSLFATKSVPSISFKDSKVGDSFTGVITELETAQVRDFETNEPKFWDDGNPQLQVVLTLATDYIDNDVEGDDGTRKLYLVGQKLTAMKAAVKEFGKQIAKGQIITITFTGEKANANKRYNATKLYGITIAEGKTNPSVDKVLGDLGAKPVPAEDAKLTPEQVAKVQKLSEAGFDDAEIAETMGVNKYAVTAVIETF